MPSLVVQIPGADVSEHALDPRKRCTIGSHAGCAVRIAAPGVPPLYCQIQHAGGRWVLRHVQGARPPLVNGRARKTAFLEHGDAISVGPAKLLFRGGGEDAAPPEALTRPARAPGRPARRAAGTRAARPARAAGGPAAVLVACGVLVVAIVGALSWKNAGSGREGSEGVEAARPVAPPPEPPPLPAEAAPSASSGKEALRGAQPEALAAAESASPEPPEPESPEFAGSELALDAAPPGPEGEPEPSAVPGGPTASRVVPWWKGPVPEKGRIDAAQWVDTVYLELAGAEPDRAEAALEDARRRSARPSLVQAVAAEIRSVRAARDALLRGLEAAVRDRVPFEVAAGTFAVPASASADLRADLGARSPFSIAKGDARAVELADAIGRPAGRFRLLSLPDGVLFRMLALGGAESPELRAGLALLLLHAEGPRRAAAFLGGEAGGGDAPGAGAAAKPAYPPEAEPRRWADRKARFLARERGRLAAARAGGPLDWASLAAEALSAWLEARGSGDEDALRAIREVYLAARSDGLPAPAIFSRAAKAEAAKDGRTRILYRFGGEKAALEAARDLRAVGAATKPPRYENGALVLAGEYRLFSGDPFAGELTLRVKARVLDPAAPNANVALWTRDDDAVTLPEGEEPNWFELLRREAGTPSDYFVFGYGYRRVTANVLERKLEEVVRVADGESVKLPALVVLAGQRGSPLHLDRGECLFAEPVASASVRRAEFSIDWRLGGVVWTAGARRIVLDAPHQRERFGSSRTRSGSITVLTNGRPLALEELEIAARLDEGWARERKREIAAGEIEAAAAWPKP